MQLHFQWVKEWMKTKYYLFTTNDYSNVTISPALKTKNKPVPTYHIWHTCKLECITSYLQSQQQTLTVQTSAKALSQSGKTSCIWITIQISTKIKWFAACETSHPSKKFTTISQHIFSSYPQKLFYRPILQR